MINYNTFGNKIKEKIRNFSKIISQGLKKPEIKFIEALFYGVSAAQSCVLTEISRELKEDIPVKKTEERIARNLKDFSREDEQKLQQNYVNYVKSSITDDTLIIVDPGDATKKCSPKMESIGSVKDGSTGGFAQGYWTMGAVVLSPNNSQPIPIYEKLYPNKENGGEGLNVEVENCLQFFRDNGISEKIPRVYDRAGDSGAIFENFHRHSESFIIRQQHNRTVIHNGKNEKIDSIVKNLECNLTMKYTGKGGRTGTCQIGMSTVFLRHFTNSKMRNFKVNLVVCKEWGEDPLVIYTNIDEPVEDIALKIVKAYLMRWRIEEMYRFKKDKLNFEGFRIRKLQAIKTLDTLVTILIGFIALLSDKVEQSEFSVSLIAASKRTKKLYKYIKETKFFFYAVSDGISAVLARLRCGISGWFKPPEPYDGQLSLVG